MGDQKKGYGIIHQLRESGSKVTYNKNSLTIQDIINSVTKISSHKKSIMANKKTGKQDPKLVAFTENDNREVKYIAAAYKIPLAVVKKAMKDLGKNGKPARSRGKIYAALRALGYVVATKAKGVNHPENKKAARQQSK